MQRKNKAYVALLIVAFVGLSLAGRYLYTNIINGEKTSSSDTSAVRPFDAGSSMRSKVATSSNQNNSESISECIANLDDDIKSNKTNYQKGTILVKFKSTVTFDSAISTLATYGLTPDDKNQTESDYSLNRVIIAKVPAKSETSKICVIKRDISVSYAGLNVLFSLHE
jgi:hypothetical protein